MSEPKICEATGVHYPDCKCGNCPKRSSASDEKGTSPDDRHFAVIHVVLYDDARRERVLDGFRVTTWISDEQFSILKEFFLETTRHAEILEEIEMTQELME